MDIQLQIPDWNRKSKLRSGDPYHSDLEFKEWNDVQIEAPIEFVMLIEIEDDDRILKKIKTIFDNTSQKPTEGITKAANYKIVKHSIL